MLCFTKKIIPIFFFRWQEIKKQNFLWGIRSRLTGHSLNSLKSTRMMTAWAILIQMTFNAYKDVMLNLYNHHISSSLCFTKCTLLYLVLCPYTVIMMMVIIIGWHCPRFWHRTTWMFKKHNYYNKLLYIPSTSTIPICAKVIVSCIFNAYIRWTAIPAAIHDPADRFLCLILPGWWTQRCRCPPPLLPAAADAAHRSPSRFPTSSRIPPRCSAPYISSFPSDCPFNPAAVQPYPRAHIF